MEMGSEAEPTPEAPPVPQTESGLTDEPEGDAGMAEDGEAVLEMD